MPAKNDFKYSEKTQKEIIQKYLEGTKTKDILSEYKMSTRTLYRIVKRVNKKPTKKTPKPNPIFKLPKTKKIKIKKHQHKNYPPDTPASNRQLYAFHTITKLDIREHCEINFHQMSKLLETLNIEKGYVRGNYKQRLSLFNFMKNNTQRVIDEIIEVTKHANIVKDQHNNKYVVFGEDVNNIMFKIKQNNEGYATRLKIVVEEFYKHYWMFVMFVYAKFDNHFKQNLLNFGTPLLTIITQNRNVQELIYNIVIEYTDEQAIPGLEIIIQ